MLDCQHYDGNYGLPRMSERAALSASCLYTISMEFMSPLAMAMREGGREGGEGRGGREYGR